MTPLLWTLKEAALALRVSAEWLRCSDCPRVLLPTRGKRQMHRFEPGEVEAWFGAHRTGAKSKRENRVA